MRDTKRYDVRLWTGSQSELIRHMENQFDNRKNKKERWLLAVRQRGPVFTYSKKLVTEAVDPNGQFTADYTRWNALCYELGFGPETLHWYNR